MVGAWPLNCRAGTNAKRCRNLLSEPTWGLRLLAVYELVPVIADVIRAHCPGSARADFMQACMHGQWNEARSMVEGMLAEPWFLRGYQENRLREFLELLSVTNTRRRLRRFPSAMHTRSERQAKGLTASCNPLLAQA
jgi:hypothetical protein